MLIKLLVPAICVVLLTGAAKPPIVDLTGYRPQPGLQAALETDTLTVRWDGETQQECLARFAIVDGVPTITELAVRKKTGKWVTLGRNLIPEFGVTTGVRRTGHGLPESNRWDVFWDAPLNHPEEVRRSTASYNAERIVVRTDGARLEVSFPGLSMGSFSGGLRFTVYRGTNLLRLEAVAKTDEPSVAYIYQGGLKGFSPEVLPDILWQGVGGEWHSAKVSAGEAGQMNVLRARNRLAVAFGKVGSIAVFPPPHQFFFARELEVNLGYVWHRRDCGNSFSMGVRQPESAGGYNPVWIKQVYSLYNAPPGTQQRMPVYFYLSPDDGNACRESVMAFTHGDRYKPLPGYKTMATHFHTAFTQELIESGSLDTTPPWIPMMRELWDQHRPHLRLPRRRSPPRPRSTPVEGVGDLLRRVSPPLGRRLPDPARGGGERLPRRSLQHPVPEAGVLDAGEKQGSAFCHERSEVREGVSHGVAPPICSS